MMPAMDGKILKHFRDQAVGSRRLGSPFTAMLCELMAGRLDRDNRFGARILDWPGDPGPDALSLRAAGGLHALARSGKSESLAAAYPPYPPDAETLWSAVEAAIRDHDAFLAAYLDSPPQTNEVARSAIVLGGCLTIAAAMRRPLALFEIGSSAGLNLAFDRYRYDLAGKHWGDETAPVRIGCDWQGEAPPLDTRLKVVARAGCELRPIDPSSAPDRERLMSYIWADQIERLARTKAALDLAQAAPWRVERADAAAWIADRLERQDGSGLVRVLFHTIVWQYLPEPTKAAIAETMRAAGEKARPTTPLAWLRMEGEGDPQAAGIRLTLWPNGSTYRLGLADYHGRWARWQAPSLVTP
jgi:hypothetical protein